MQTEKTEKQIEKDITFVRNFAPGFIGGKDMAKEATDEEIRCLILLNSKITKSINDPAKLNRKGERFLIFVRLTELGEGEKRILASIRSRLTKASN